MSDDQVAVPPPSPCEHRFITTYGIVDGPDSGKVTMWACQECRIRFYPHDNVDRALLTRQEALLAALRETVEYIEAEGGHSHCATQQEDGWLYGCDCGYQAKLDRWTALLDASQPVKP